MNIEKNYKAIPRVSLYSRLLLPIIFVGLLGLFIIHNGVRPDSVWTAFDLQKITDLPSVLWIMVLTGLTGFLLGSWVWILKPKSLPALLFGLSGIATLAFTFSPLSFFFTTPLSPEWEVQLSRLNMYGASLFGIVMCALLLVYPSRSRFYQFSAPLLCGVFLALTIWAAWDPQRIDYFVQFITFIEMVFIVLFSLWQIIANRGQADKYIVAIWLSACVIIGSGPFIALVAMPMTFGYPPRIPPHYAFIFFNLLYIGFAVGLLRLRLFDLGSWAFQLFFHAGLVIIFIVVDLTLISVLAIQKGVASSLTMIALAIFYLPVRGWLSTVLGGQKKINEVEMFQSVVETGLKSSGHERAVSWVNLLRETFKPLDMSENRTSGHMVNVSSDGQSLSIPAAMGAPAIVLEHKYKGRALFTTKDQKLAEHIMTLINQVDESRRAYDRGVSEERLRIGQDIHDNIGAQLLQALHSERKTRKDEMIRESLSDLRDVINNASGVRMPLADMLADLRAETVERTAYHNIRLKWSVADFGQLELSSQKLHALRSVLREAVSNVVKHSQASLLEVQISLEKNEIHFQVKDDGQGLSLSNDETRVHEGQGLKNMRSRVENLGGQFHIVSTDKGTCVSGHFDCGADEI